mmetsp:Transcript_42726/g.59892  ORF Transcript_42726/g.59892 Transcript_42726/m.59892 type:complete len:270 (+) Transcript_42726:94-903(+)
MSSSQSFRDTDESYLSLSSSQFEDEDSFAFQMEKVSILQGVLQHLHFAKKHQIAIVNVCVKTVRFVVEESHIWQASLSLSEEIFSSFRATDTVRPFKIPLSILLTCLNIYGPHSSGMISMDYQGYGQPLKVSVTEDSVLSEISLRTFDCEDLMFFSTDFRRFEIYNKVILHANILKEALMELDWSNDTLTVYMSPDHPHFQFSTGGAYGSFEIQFPSSSEAFVEFDCRQSQQFTYRLQHFQPAVKAAGTLATQTQIRMNEKGMLCVQHM